MDSNWLNDLNPNLVLALLFGAVLIWYLGRDTINAFIVRFFPETFVKGITEEITRTVLSELIKRAMLTETTLDDTFADNLAALHGFAVVRNPDGTFTLTPLTPPDTTTVTTTTISGGSLSASDVISTLNDKTYLGK